MEPTAHDEPEQVFSKQNPPPWRVLGNRKRGDRALVLAVDGPIRPPGGAPRWEVLGFVSTIRVPADVQVSAQSLRDPASIQAFRNAWERLIDAIDQGVNQAVDCRGWLHVFATCPYAAGFYLGERLHRAARDLPLVIYQYTRAGGWTPFLTPNSPVGSGKGRFFDADTLELEGGQDYVVSIEIARSPDEKTLRRLGERTGAGWIHRLVPRERRSVEPGEDAAGVRDEILVLLDEFQNRHPQRRVHLVTSAPLALAIAVGGLFNRNVYRSLVVHDYGTRQEPPGYYPVLDIMRRQVNPPWMGKATGDTGPSLTPPGRPLFSNDGIPTGRILEHDRLDMRVDAEDFARLMVARDVDPPLAIGLFGEWGVGKSYFMRCVRAAVDDLLKQAGAREGSPYVRNVVHIDFNAWHYADTNLWAVLAVHIFERLAEHIRGRPSKENELEAYSRQIASSIEARDAAKRRLEVATKTRREASEKLERLDAEKRMKIREYGRAMLDYWREKNAPANSGHGKQNEDRLRALEKCAEMLGLTPVVQTVDDVLALVDRVEQARHEVPGPWRALLLKGWRYLLLVLAFLGVVIFLLVLGFGEGWWRVVSGVLTAVSSFVAVFAALRPAVKNVTTLIAGLNEGFALKKELLALRDEIEGETSGKDKKELDGEVGEVVDHRKKIVALEAEIARESQRIEECAFAIQRAQRQILHIQSGGVVYDFLSDRIASDDYQNHLGLLSTIRRDFERLEETLQKWRASVDESRQDDGGRSPGEAADGPEAAGKPPIDRIILYIDDLDRCQPDQVVRVLQAVHLLLAFKLFVVVVAVDARWLQHSLKQTFLLGGSVAGVGERAAQQELAFSPQNYLEKIFQIPFALEEMSEEGYGTLIETIDAEVRGGERWDAPKDHVRVGLSAHPDEGPGQGGSSLEETLGPGEPGKTAGEWPEQAEAVTDDAAGESALLVLEPHETEFLKVLYPFVRTPRAAKRLVNVYRIVRVGSSRKPGGFAGFIDERHGAYRAVLVLLGILARFPETGCRVLRSLAASREKHDDVGAEQALMEVGEARGDPETLESFVRACITRLTRDDGQTRGAWEGWVSDVQDTQTLASVRRDLEALTQILEGLRGEIPEPIGVYRSWARVVGRHSFNWNILVTRPLRPESMT